MADFAARVPIETEKSTYLHDRSNRPSPPARTLRSYAQRYRSFAFSVGMALGFSALAFQLRDYWGGPRDWVVPVTTPLIVLGGLSLGFLIARGQLWAAWPASLALGVTLILTVLNISAEAVQSNHNTFAYALNVMAAVGFGVTIILAVVGMVAAEVSRPIRPPSPEL